MNGGKFIRYSTCGAKGHRRVSNRARQQIWDAQDISEDKVIRTERDSRKAR